MTVLGLFASSAKPVYLSQESLQKKATYVSQVRPVLTYPAIQLVKSLRNEYQQRNIRILKAEKFLANLFL